jgi:hypothetical protein
MLPANLPSIDDAKGTVFRLRRALRATFDQMSINCYVRVFGAVPDRAPYRQWLYLGKDYIHIADVWNNPNARKRVLTRLYRNPRSWRPVSASPPTSCRTGDRPNEKPAVRDGLPDRGHWPPPWTVDRGAALFANPRAPSPPWAQWAVAVGLPVPPPLPPDGWACVYPGQPPGGARDCAPAG